MNTFLNAQEGVTRLLLTAAPRIEAMGFVPLSVAALALMIWTVYQTALGGYPSSLIGFTKTVGLILLAFLIMATWNAPLFGVVSFPNLITEQANAVSRALDLTTTERAAADIQRLQRQVVAPSAFAVTNGLIYWSIQLIFIIAKTLTTVVTAFEYIAAAVVRLFGPLFLWTILIPRLSGMWWGWLKAFILFSFAPCVSHAYLLVGQAFLAAVVAAYPEAITANDYLTTGFDVAVYVLVYALGILFSPVIAGVMLGGSLTSGLSVLSAGVASASAFRK